MTEEKKNKKIITKLKHKYRLVVINDESFKEELSFELSRLNVIIAVLGLISITAVITFFLITQTPVRKYLPGASYEEIGEQIEELQEIADSLDFKQQVNELYIQNIKAIAKGEIPEDPLQKLLSDSLKDVEFKNPSKEDSLLRNMAEDQMQKGLSLKEVSSNSVASYTFFTPLQGMISANYDPELGHYGVDLLAQEGTAIKSALDGVVVMAEWSVETGHLLLIQHKDDLITVYKHNSVLLKKQGELVRAGDPIAIVGNSGENTTGPHLHFEIWFKNVPVNPENYMSF
ncbi:M23 family metallopeptidase [Flavobacteriales bacterium]|nr:M23 family metallopeptidase [Flavobacteriales bacterium]